MQQRACLCARGLEDLASRVCETEELDQAVAEEKSSKQGCAVGGA